MYVEIELGNEDNRIFLLIDSEERLWIDTMGVPHSAFFCALFDGIEIMTAEVGAEGGVLRQFIPMEWCIEHWGGDKQIVEALKKRKQMTLDDMPRIREKYPDIFGRTGSE